VTRELQGEPTVGAEEQIERARAGSLESKAV
jgi:hypothetical protein